MAAASHPHSSDDSTLLKVGLTMYTKGYIAGLQRIRSSSTSARRYRSKYAVAGGHSLVDPIQRAYHGRERGGGIVVAEDHQ